MSGKYARLVTELQALQKAVTNTKNNLGGVRKESAMSDRSEAVLRIVEELRAAGVTVPEPVTALSLIQFLQQQGGKRKTRRNRKNNNTRKQRKQRKQRN